MFGRLLFVLGGFVSIMRVRFECEDGVRQVFHVNPKNLARLRSKRGDLVVV